MPQVDLESLVSVYAGGGDGDCKIACETLPDGDCDREQKAVESDLPPAESFWLSKDTELDWFDRNAVYGRKDSTKGNSKSSNLNPSSNSPPHRFSMNLKSRASVIGLPKKTTHVVDTTKRKPANIRLFPKRSVWAGKSTVAVAEPSSPTVSCMGRVRSKRGRRRPKESAAAGKSRNYRRRSTGICGAFLSLFRRSKPADKTDEPTSVESPQRKNELVKASESPAKVEPEATASIEPPGIGGMKRFVSGRRSASWGVDEWDQ